jgi:hypothetical protein
MRFPRRKEEHSSGKIRLLTNIERVFPCVVLLAVGATRSSAQQLTPTWVQLGEGGKAIARVVVAAPGKCPSISLDGASKQMLERHPIPDGFRPLCEAVIPSNTKSAKVTGQALFLPKPNPSNVIAFGDTGCLIKGKELQDCKDPKKWPFEEVASSAAAENPDLMIHVGDYLYRESPCPAGSELECGDTPEGDNWEAWNTDFFTPAAKLLAHATWAFARGNHESCDRSWRGWFYYLDPRPWNGVCERYSLPYVIKLGSFELAIFDSSEVVVDSLDEKQVSAYTAQLAGLHVENAWLVAHHPFWGFKNGTKGEAYSPVSAPLQEAWYRASPKGISLILSGHVHLFELMAFDHEHPTQVVAGGGGTNLALPIPVSLDGIAVRGSTIIGSQSLRQFGYTVLEKRGSSWRLTLKNERQNELFGCSLFEGGHAKSPAGRASQGNEPDCSGI